jgi:hypothetical protein
LRQLYRIDQDYLRKVIAAARADVGVGVLPPGGAKPIIE